MTDTNTRSPAAAMGGLGGWDVRTYARRPTHRVVVPPHPTGNAASDAWPDPAAGFSGLRPRCLAGRMARLVVATRPTPHHRSRSLIARYLGTWTACATAPAVTWTGPCTP